MSRGSRATGVAPRVRGHPSGPLRAGPSPLPTGNGGTGPSRIDTSAPASASFDLLPTEECFGLLSSTTVGRVAFVGPHGLVLRPVNYRVVGGNVLVRTSTTSALADLADHRDLVLFEVDYHAPSAPEGWSVLVQGTCTRLTGDEVPADPQVGALVPWTCDTHDLLLSIRPRLVTGRRVG